ncbi:hypothetical protein ACH5RR_021949 [Cinchona calisaya]|uniref:Uncharacterized protein n=1 Tax=Cinchona calisaya TaxID=153742 RepID=A0ABD2Z9N7_9GENT
MSESVNFLVSKQSKKFDCNSLITCHFPCLLSHECENILASTAFSTYIDSLAKQRYSTCKYLREIKAAKDVLAEKPVTSDGSSQLDPSLLDELLANIATLSCVYHKLPEAFVTRVKIAQKTEEDDFADLLQSSAQYAGRQRVAALAAPAAHAPVSDLLDLGLNNSGAIVSVDQPTNPAEHTWKSLPDSNEVSKDFPGL